MVKISDTYKVWYSYAPHIPRQTRYSLGEKINLLFLELMELILLAAYAAREQKAPIIQKASLKVDTLKYFVQLAWELKILDNKRFAALGEPLAEVGKMIGGWKKQLGNQTLPL